MHDLNRKRLWLALLGTLIASPAWSQSETKPCDEAEALVREGLQKRLAHGDQDALALFIRAEALCPGPRVLAQRALAEQALGLWIAAEEHLGKALAAEEDAWIEKHRQELAATLTEVGEHLGLLEVTLETSGVAGAELLVDGRRVAQLPLTDLVRAVAGTVVIEVRAPGFSSVMRSVTVPSRGVARERVTLVSLASSVAKSPARPAVDKLVLVRRIGIIGTAVGAVILGGGVAAQVVREQAARAYAADPSCATRSGDLPESCQVLLGRVVAGERLAAAGYVVGGALAVGGILLAVLPARIFDRRGERPRSVTLLPGPGQIGLGLLTRF